MNSEWWKLRNELQGIGKSYQWYYVKYSLNNDQVPYLYLQMTNLKIIFIILAESPVERTENDFDPGAKYHIPANVPYIR